MDSQIVQRNQNDRSSRESDTLNEHYEYTPSQSNGWPQKNKPASTSDSNNGHWEYTSSRRVGSTRDSNGDGHGPPISSTPSARHAEAMQPVQNDPRDAFGVEEDDFYNRFSRYRAFFMEYAAEFWGTMILVIFGCGANCQFHLGSDPNISPTPQGNYTTDALGWAAGLAFGVWVSAGHINPAVTLAFAVWRGFPWRKVPGYILAQLLGGIVGAAIVYGNYKRAIDIFEGGANVRTLKSAGFFGTVPLTYATNITCFFNEFIGTALLLMGLMALTDKKNKLKTGLVPLGLFILMIGISTALGMQTGFAINPARDLGPRILTAMVGYGGQVFTLRHHYWAYSPLFGCIMGAQFGALFYDLLLFTGDESIVNKLRVRSGLYPKMKKDPGGKLAGGPGGMV